MSTGRREFLAWTAAAAAGAALTPVINLVELAQARSPEEAASALSRWGLLIDIAKCTDCDDCVTACHGENGVTGNGRPETDPQWIRKVSLRDLGPAAAACQPTSSASTSGPARSRRWDALHRSPPQDVGGHDSSRGNSETAVEREKMERNPLRGPIAAKLESRGVSLTQLLEPRRCGHETSRSAGAQA